MEKIKHNDLIQMLSNLQFPDSEDFNKLFLLTKKEDLIRDFLIVEIEKKISLHQKEFEYLAYPEWKKHDCVLLKNEKNNIYIPTSLIEFKYATSPFILGRQSVDITAIHKSHDSIWVENYRPKNIKGHGRGVKADLLKMIDTANIIHEFGHMKPNIHSVINILVPKSPINSQLYSIIHPRTKKDKDSHVIQNDFQEFKKYIEIYKDNPEKLVIDIKNVIEEQFILMKKKFFSEHYIKTGFTSISIGKAFGTELELFFFVMSIE